MTTESELHALASMLGLVDIGDAASYLGEVTARIEERGCEHVPLPSLPSLENTTDNQWCSIFHKIGMEMNLYKQMYANRTRYNRKKGGKITMISLFIAAHFYSSPQALFSITPTELKNNMMFNSPGNKLPFYAERQKNRGRKIDTRTVRRVMQAFHPYRFQNEL